MNLADGVGATHLVKCTTTFRVLSPERLLLLNKSAFSAVSFPSSTGIVPVRMANNACHTKILHNNKSPVYACAGHALWKTTTGNYQHTVDDTYRSGCSVSWRVHKNVSPASRPTTRLLSSRPRCFSAYSPTRTRDSCMFPNPSAHLKAGCGAE
ncbi:unnamed protein product [Ectocarpus sp. 8 AP-2014]